MNARGASRRAARWLAALGAGIAVCAPLAVRGDVPFAVRGDARLQLFPRTQPWTATARFALRAPLPARPWTTPAPITLPGSASSPPLPLPDGGLVIGLASPPALAWIAPDGRIRATTELGDRVQLELAVGAQGRVFAVADNGLLYIVAGDGTVRDALRVLPIPQRGPIVRADGTVALLSTTTASASELLLLAPSGEPLATRAVLSRLVSAPLLGDDGCLWLTFASGAACLDPRGELLELSGSQGVQQTVPLADGSVVTVTNTEIQLRTRRGAMLGRLDAGSSAGTPWPLPGGGFALPRAGTPGEVWIVSHEGTVSARLPAPPSTTTGVFTDPNGALLVVGSSGILAVYEPDGTPRWSLTIPHSIMRAPVPLPGGGVVVASGNALLCYR